MSKAKGSSKDKVKSTVFNSSIGSPYAWTHPNYSAQQENEILAGLFEQLLIFDKITISTNRLNSGLVFLIRHLGINTVERLLDCGYIQFMIWTPVIVTSSGTQRDDGTIDESTIYGQPPIAAGSLSNEDKDPERNINVALANFSMHRDRRRIFTNQASKHYIVPNGMEFSSDSSKLILEAFKNNNLEELGLPFNKEPEQLHLNERTLLLKLGHKIIETAILSKYSMKSFENYEHYAICKQNLSNIGKAYNVTGNSDVLFSLEMLPNLKHLFIEERLKFEDVFRIRHMKIAKYYRNWINTIGENANSQEITKEYLNEIKGNGKFFESTEGKFIRNLGMYSANTALGAAVAGPIGAVAGYTFGLLETYWLDALLKGKNPSMFIDEIKKTIAVDEQ